MKKYKNKTVFSDDVIRQTFSKKTKNSTKKTSPIKFRSKLEKTC